LEPSGTLLLFHIVLWLMQRVLVAFVAHNN